MRFKMTFICLGVIAFVLVGCGGDGGTTDSGSTAASGGGSTTTSAGDGNGASADGTEKVAAARPLTKKQFIKEGDLICKRFALIMLTELSSNKKKYGPGTSQPTAKQAEAGLLEVVLPQLQEEAEALDELPAPSGDEAEIASIIAALEKGVQRTEANPDLVSARPNPLDEASKLSKKYGFKECGS